MADLIERSAAIEALDRFSLGETDAVKLSIRMIAYLQRMPAVDAVPVRHGYWIIRFFGDKAKCSECGRIFADVYDLEDYDHYCRHCGAVMDRIKMDGKDGNK